MWQAIFGLGGVVLVALAGFGLSYRALGRANADSERADGRERELETKMAALEVSDRSVAALRTEADDLKTANSVLAAKLATTEKQRDDLLHTIENAPAGAPVVASALRVELERLRELSKASPAAAAGGQGGGEAGVVHGVAASGSAKS
jgi:hypothetical protein